MLFFGHGGSSSRDGVGNGHSLLIQLMLLTLHQTGYSRNYGRVHGVVSNDSVGETSTTTGTTGSDGNCSMRQVVKIDANNAVLVKE